MEKTYKGRQRTDTEDRSEVYRNWRHTFGDARYVVDIDQLEYKIENDEVIPVAVIEITREDEKVRCAKALQDAVLYRINEQYAQGKALIKAALMLRVDAYVCIFLKDLSEFHVYNLTKPNGWRVMDQRKYRRWIDWLHR